MFTKEEIMCLEFVNKWKCGDSISDEDVNTVAYANLSGLVQPFVELITTSFNEDYPNITFFHKGYVFEFMEQYGEQWDDYGERWDDCLDGNIYIAWYTGDAGCYWNEDDRYTICRPW